MNYIYPVRLDLFYGSCILQFDEFCLRWVVLKHRYHCLLIPFSIKDNKYSVLFYNSLCSEFNIYPNSDFHVNRGKKHSFGAVYIGLLEEEQLIQTIYLSRFF